MPSAYVCTTSTSWRSRIATSFRRVANISRTNSGKREDAVPACRQDLDGDPELLDLGPERPVIERAHDGAHARCPEVPSHRAQVLLGTTDLEIRCHLRAR